MSKFNAKTIRRTLIAAILGSVSSAAIATENTQTLQAEKVETAAKLELKEGFNISMQSNEIDNVFEGSGLGISYQTNFGNLLTAHDERLNLYGRMHYQINRSDEDAQLAQADITLGLNFAHSDKLHVYLESAMLQQEVSGQPQSFTRSYDVTRLGARYNFKKSLVLNAATIHRNGDQNELGYRIAVESTKKDAYSVGMGFSSVGDNDSLFISIFSKF
ncbi:hypothetical protein AAEU28_20155 [Pseudoalteromonas sp. SS15]|uniref:hypothetical protein n=1 Tax=Pseudoalteromonas sp. SS15 TaxID=3139393 RepID=UPI003BA9FC61